MEEEFEERCFSVVTDKRFAISVNLYHINEEDILECNRAVPEQFEESLDDNEKLLDIVDKSNTLCNVHNAHSVLRKFRNIMRDEKTTARNLAPE